MKSKHRLITRSSVSMHLSTDFGPRVTRNGGEYEVAPGTKLIEQHHITALQNGQVFHFERSKLEIVQCYDVRDVLWCELIHFGRNTDAHSERLRKKAKSFFKEKLAEKLESIQHALTQIELV